MLLPCVLLRDSRTTNIESSSVLPLARLPVKTANKDAQIKLTTGTFIDESIYNFSGGRENWGKGNINHMTIEQNQQWAEKVYGRLRV